MMALMIMFNPGLSQAKPPNAQDRIILLNDAAAALEDFHPGLSQSLFKMADEKEKEWEASNVKSAPPPAANKNTPELKKQMEVLRKAALIIHPTYPLIAQGLIKMAKEMDATVEIKK